MLYCVAGFLGGMLAGKILDKYKCYKTMLIGISMSIICCLCLTFAGLYYDLSHLFELGVIILTGAPMFSVTAPTYQFVAEVTYPVSELQGQTIINVINKLISFVMARFTTYLTKTY